MSGRKNFREDLCPFCGEETILEYPVGAIYTSDDPHGPPLAIISSIYCPRCGDMPGIRRRRRIDETEWNWDS